MPKAAKLPSGSWRARAFSHVDANGKRVYKSFTAPTRKEAEYAASAYEVKKKTSIADMTVGDAIDRYIDSKDAVLSPATIHFYRQLRKHHLKGIMDIKLKNITREDIQKCVNEESKSSSPKTVSSAHGLLSAALRVQMPDFILNTRLPRKVRPLHRELPTSAEVYAAVKGTPIELPVLLAMWLCLRVSEVRGIRKESIHGDKLYIDRVIITVANKSIEKELAKTDSSRRILDLPPILKKMILENKTEYVTHLSERSLYGRFVHRMKMHGWTGVRFHDLRHIAASDMNKLGIPDRVAAERGGWSNTATLQAVYQHAFTEDRIKADELVNSYYEDMLKSGEEELNHE